MTFSGTKLDVVQRPVMIVNDTGYLDTITVSEKQLYPCTTFHYNSISVSNYRLGVTMYICQINFTIVKHIKKCSGSSKIYSYLSSSLNFANQNSSCKVHNSTAISCETPTLARVQSKDTDGLNYTIAMDNASGPDLTVESLRINVLPNPENFVLITTSIKQQQNASILISVNDKTITRCKFIIKCLLQGDNLDSVGISEIRVTVGGKPCVDLEQSTSHVRDYLIWDIQM